MSTKIVLIRGTSGSGKSHVAHSLLKQFPSEEVKNTEGKIIAYRTDAGLKHPIYLLGKYTNVCGGLDGCPTQQEAANMALYFSNKQNGHVLGEGLLQSAAGPKGALTKAVYENNNAVFAVLDTPVEVCLDRVRARRAARGDERPLNEKNTRDKYTQTHSTAKAMLAAGYDVRLIDHKNAYEEVMNIFREAEHGSK